MATTKIKKVTTIVQYDLNGEKKEPGITLSKEIFDVVVSSPLLAQYVRVFLVNQRQGNASTKTRAEVAGTTKKMYKQKGTGKARHGSYKAPLFKGGGVVGGPKPKIYELFMNKKQKLKTLFGSLSLKAKEDGVLNLDVASEKKTLKTKDVADWLKKVELIGVKVLFVLEEKNTKNFTESVRNIADISYTGVRSLNAYSVLSADRIVFVGNAIKELENHFVKKNED